MCSINHFMSAQGNFNKLKMLQKVLNDTPPASAGGAGWLWWLDIDTVVDPAQVCYSSPWSVICAEQCRLCHQRSASVSAQPPGCEGLITYGALQALPLEQYGGHDIVLWGERELVEAGDIQGARNGP